MKGLLAILLAYWLWAIVIAAPLALTGCFGVGGYETYGGIRRVDSRRVIEDTIATKGSWTDSLTNWMFNPKPKKDEA